MNGVTVYPPVKTPEQKRITRNVQEELSENEGKYTLGQKLRGFGHHLKMTFFGKWIYSKEENDIYWKHFDELLKQKNIR